jgi:plastocyanin
MNIKNRLPLILMSSIGILVVLVLTIVLLTMFNKKEDTVKAVETNVAYIAITDSGFEPAELKITSGMTVTWRNKTEAPHQVASNPYPAHTDLPELFSETYIQPTGEYSYTFATAGTFGYHDYLNPDLSGKVIVADK